MYEKAKKENKIEKCWRLVHFFLIQVKMRFSILLYPIYDSYVVL